MDIDSRLPTVDEDLKMDGTSHNGYPLADTQPQTSDPSNQCDYLSIKNDSDFTQLLKRENDCFPNPEQVLFSDYIVKVCFCCV